ncbi:hypothetical protein [Nostoc sp.]|uniref:hypothetical protein n=1 Tax=Nostoc sp. TaxID=1180 RepID=UPI002FFC0C21
MERNQRPSPDGDAARTGDALYETLPRTRTRYRYANTSRLQKETFLGALVHHLQQRS